MPKLIQLDGTTLEGGGQLLRIAIGLSALIQQPLKIFDIRGKRSGGGGLKSQHLTCVRWLSRASGAPTIGAEKKSRSLEFFANDHDQSSLKLVNCGWNKMDTVIEIGSPGAIGLVLQAILPYVLFAGALHTNEEMVYISIKGGTNVSNSPSVDYIERVMCPMLELIGLPRIEINCRARGWSTGKPEIGTVTFGIKPLRLGESLKGFEIAKRGEIIRIEAIALGPRSSEKIFHKVLKTALAEFGLQDVPLDNIFELSGHEKRLYILLVVHMSTGIRFGRDNLYQERVSTLERAVTKMVYTALGELKTELDHDGSVDEFMRDQLVVYQALAQGRSKIIFGASKPSLHTQTAQWVTNQILQVEGTDDMNGVGWVVGQKWTKEGVDDLLVKIKSIELDR
ncbi:RNA 3'-phosphate cyclase [Verruconis gallopava]|uniref:RNA 3'-phosphate cyclase n=1 Tax=Verruconis gallopava TaxID=253628 RepID=A0A0D2AE58_9PEZI|nr:RNA 3'-phosphate cyclase [Verruconis gallopava]KIW04750.1 RNA 3'-phosphate cyclase [Verruconis gallopava]